MIFDLGQIKTDTDLDMWLRMVTEAEIKAFIEAHEQLAHERPSSHDVCIGAARVALRGGDPLAYLRAAGDALPGFYEEEK